MPKTEQEENLEIAERIFDGWLPKAPMIRLYKAKLIEALAEDIGRELAPYRKRIAELELEVNPLQRL